MQFITGVRFLLFTAFSFRINMTDQKSQINDLPHCPQVFGHRSFTCEFVPQYCANLAHFVDLSSHTSCVGASTVVDVASVSGTAEKQFYGSDKFYHNPFHFQII